MESPFGAISQSLYVSFSKSPFSVTEDSNEDSSDLVTAVSVLCIVQGSASLARRATPAESGEASPALALSWYGSCPLRERFSVVK